MNRNLIALLLLIVSINSYASSVLIRTSLGDITVELFEDVAPNTVANFLNYIRNNDYQQSFIHRSVPNFVIQGGGFSILNLVAGFVPTDPAINSELNISNTRGTIAMALSNIVNTNVPDINSATNQWFINTGNNTGLDSNFTVFGEVTEGLDVVDAIAALPIQNLNPIDPISGSPEGPLGEVPLTNLTGSVVTSDENFIITELFEISESFIMNPGIAGSWFNAETSGQGFTFDVDINNNVFVATWFTFDINEPDVDENAGFGSNQHRWFIASGGIDGNTATLDILAPSGGVFNDPRAVNNGDSLGTATVTFIDCTNAEITFDFINPNVNDPQTVSLNRITPADTCEANQLL